MGKTYCCGLHPQGSIYLIAIVDIILGFVSTLLSIVALVNLQKVFGQIENDKFEDLGFPPISSDNSNEEQTKSGLNEFTRKEKEIPSNIHGQMIIVLLLSIFYLVLALGLLLGIRKEYDWPIKAWFLYGSILNLFAGISIFVLCFVSGHLLWLLLMIFILLRTYEIWVIYDYLKNSRFSSLISSLTIRSSSTERLHNV